MSITLEQRKEWIKERKELALEYRVDKAKTNEYVKNYVAER